MGEHDTVLSLSTALRGWHESHGGRMVDFAGWLMPIQYSSIIEEHHATRNAVGLFDVSHMGRFYFSGTAVDQFLDRLTTRRVAGIDPGKIRYSLMTNEQGGILDDVLVYHLQLADGESQFMMVVNAGNRLKIRDWILSQVGDHDVQLDDRTEATTMLAVQGPQACGVIAELADLDPASLGYYSGRLGRVCGHQALVSRTGYTGEDGCELIVDRAASEEIADAIIDKAGPLGGCPVGLGARDTLRLEAAMPLYGHELTESVNAAQTDLGFAMNLKDREFVGRQSILDAKRDTSLPVRMGLELEGKRAAREGCTIIVGDKPVGVITSGTFSPTLQRAISMGYIDREYAAVGTKLQVDIRGKLADGVVVKLPFYSRS